MRQVCNIRLKKWYSILQTIKDIAKLSKALRKLLLFSCREKILCQKIKLEVQNLYTSFLLWTENNYQSSSSLYKDFTAQSLVERNFTQENYSGNSVQLPTIGLQPNYSIQNQGCSKTFLKNKRYTYRRNNGKSTFCFLPCQLKAVRKPWWNHKPLPFVFTKHFFHAIESFHRQLVKSNLSFIITETFRWQIFYTVNYRRQLINHELPISNVYHYQANWLFQELCLLSKPNRV